MNEGAGDLPEWRRTLEGVGRAAMPDVGDLRARIVRAVMPDFSGLEKAIVRAATPNAVRVDMPIVRVAFPDLDRINEAIVRTALSNLDGLNEAVRVWVVSATSIKASVVDIRIARQIGRTVACAVAIEVTSGDVRSDPRYRVAFNEWTERHALAICLWLAAGVIAIFWGVASVSTPELVELVEAAVSTPMNLVCLGLAVWTVVKQQR